MPSYLHINISIFFIWRSGSGQTWVQPTIPLLAISRDKVWSGNCHLLESAHRLSIFIFNGTSWKLFLPLKDNFIHMAVYPGVYCWHSVSTWHQASLQWSWWHSGSATHLSNWSALRRLMTVFLLICPSCCRGGSIIGSTFVLASFNEDQGFECNLHYRFVRCGLKYRTDVT